MTYNIVQIQVQAWNRLKNMTGLNRLMVS